MTSLTTYQQANPLTPSLRWLGRSLTAIPDFQLYTTGSAERNSVENYIGNQWGGGLRGVLQGGQVEHMFSGLQ